MFERELRDLAYVPRWSIVRVAKPQSVAEHSFFVAMYADMIAELINWRYRGNRENLIRAALWHDVEECYTGDIPGPTKRELFVDSHFEEVVAAGNTARFDDQWKIAVEPEEKRIIKAAGLLDEVLFLAGELQRGNKACAHIFQYSQSRLIGAWMNLPGNPDFLLDRYQKVIVPTIDREADGYSYEHRNNNDLAPSS